jgi:hypothetical protein
MKQENWEIALEKRKVEKEKKEGKKCSKIIFLLNMKLVPKDHKN